MTISIESIISVFENETGIILRKIEGKKIIYEGETSSKSSIVVCMPKSKLYERGHGWVDFTKLQVDLFLQYDVAISVFRLPNSQTYYVNLKMLFPLLNQENIKENSREGEHWKLYIWPDKLVVQGNPQQTLMVNPNQLTDILDFN